MSLAEPDDFQSVTGQGIWAEMEWRGEKKRFYIGNKKLCDAQNIDLGIYAQKAAQMAESVDALVSNTSGFTSIPVRPRVWVRINPDNHLIIRVFCFYRAY